MQSLRAQSMIMKGLDFATPKHNVSHDEVTFDQKRMERALDGQRFVMPDGLTREEFRAWMRENARKCRTR